MNRDPAARNNPLLVAAIAAFVVAVVVVIVWAMAPTSGVGPSPQASGADVPGTLDPANPGRTDETGAIPRDSGDVGRPATDSP